MWLSADRTMLGSRISNRVSYSVDRGTRILAVLVIVLLSVQSSQKVMCGCHANSKTVKTEFQEFPRSSICICSKEPIRPPHHIIVQ